MRPSYLIAMIAVAAACTARPGDHDLAASIAKGLVAACPAGSSPADEVARNDCAGKLTELGVLRDAMCARLQTMSAVRSALVQAPPRPPVRAASP